MDMRMTIAALVWAICATGAQPAVIVHAFDTPLEVRDEFFGHLVPVDLNGDGSIDFTFGSEVSGTSLRTERANRTVIRLRGGLDIGGPITPLPHGYLLGQFLAPGGNWPLLWASTDFLGGFVSPGENSFTAIVVALSTGSASDFSGRAPIGVEFAAADGLHYGYLDIAAGPGYAGITFYGWAYETQSGVPIAAGAVPEPSIAVFLTIALAALSSRRPKREY